jgi:hypothetical protein
LDKLYSLVFWSSSVILLKGVTMGNRKKTRDVSFRVVLNVPAKLDVYKVGSLIWEAVEAACPSFKDVLVFLQTVGDEKEGE